MIGIDTRQLRRLEQHLTTCAKKALPFAVRNGLNSTAFAARKEWAETQLPKAFTLRNKWVQKSIRVDKAGGRNVDTMESRVGSVLPFMKEQEEGFTEHKKGKHGVAVPGTFAAGQVRSPKRTRAIRRKNYLSALQVTKRVSGIRQRRNAVAISMAMKQGGGVVFLDLGKKKGLFQVEGSKRGLRIRKLYDLSKGAVKTKAHPTLARTLKAIQPQLPGIWEKALMDELKRNKVLWYGMWGR